jgi:stage II sporulation protein D
MGQVGQTGRRRRKARLRYKRLKERVGNAAKRLLQSPVRFWRAWEFGWGLAGLCITALTVGALLMLTPWGCSPKGTTAGPVATPQRSVRVRLLQGQDAVFVRASRPPVYSTTADPTERILNLPPDVAMALVWTAQGWRCGTANLGPGELILKPSAVGSVKVADGTNEPEFKTYRGQLRLVQVAGKVDVVNDVDLDDYLKSVISRELYPKWQDETYKAQAIVARTYALYQKSVKDGRPAHFDLHDDTRSQVYGGLAAETEKSRLAVDGTAGIVAAHGAPGEERIFKAYFSSCCGGVTQSNADAFNEAPVPALGEQSVGALCGMAGRYTWGPVVLSKEEASRRLREWGASKGRAEKSVALVRGIEITARNRFKRPVRYTVTDSRGNRYSLSSEELRWAMNYGGEGTTLYSGYVETIVNESDRIRFIGGHGHGHGVGMCQWCSEARALAGMRHEDIVTAAYPGARLMRAY